MTIKKIKDKIDLEQFDVEGQIVFNANCTTDCVQYYRSTAKAYKAGSYPYCYEYTSPVINPWA